MTPHDDVADEQLDPVDGAVDQRLAAALRDARTATRSPDRHAFLVAARVRRDHQRRRRRGWIVATPIVAAALVLVAIGVIASGGDTSSMNASKAIQAASAGSSHASTSPACPDKPGTPNTKTGERLFDFTPTALTLCTYGVDGQLVKAEYVPGKGTASVTETLDHLQRDRNSSNPASQPPSCSDDGAVPVDRAGVIATAEDRHDTAWFAISTCTVPDTARGPDGTVSFHGEWADVQITPSGDSVTIRSRPSGSQPYGEPKRIEGPNDSDAWTDGLISLTDVTIHVIGLADGSSVVNVNDLTDFAMGTTSCGQFECVVYEVPRDRTGPTPEVKVRSNGQISSIPLDSVPEGAGVLRFHVDG